MSDGSCQRSRMGGSPKVYFSHAKASASVWCLRTAYFSPSALARQNRFSAFQWDFVTKAHWGLNKPVGTSFVPSEHRAEGKAAARSEFPKNRVTSESVPPLSARGQRASRVLAEFAGFRDKIHPMPAIQRHVGTLLFATFSFVQRKS